MFAIWIARLSDDAVRRQIDQLVARHDKAKQHLLMRYRWNNIFNILRLLDNKPLKLSLSRVIEAKSVCKQLSSYALFVLIRFKHLLLKVERG